MFGLFKKSLPILTSAMIKPIDLPITTTRAQGALKQYMKEIGCVDSEALHDAVELLAENIKDHEQYLREELDVLEVELLILIFILKDLENRLSNCSSGKKEDIEHEIEALNVCDVEVCVGNVVKAATKLANFKKDKRSFLVGHINRKFHGDDWKSKLA